jgi:hypothetical protein
MINFDRDNDASRDMQPFLARAARNALCTAKSAMKSPAAPPHAPAYESNRRHPKMPPPIKQIADASFSAPT